jgi:hypothetical protein
MIHRKMDRRSQPVASYWCKAILVAEQRLSLGKDEMRWVGFVTYQQHQYVLVSDVILHPPSQVTPPSWIFE